MDADIRSRLHESENTIRRLREERGRLHKLFDGAKKAAQESEGEATLNAAMAAKQSLAEIDEQLEEATATQIGLLKQVGDAEARLPGYTSNVNGWREAARSLDLASGNLRVDLPGASLTRPTAEVPGGGAGNAGTAATISVRTAPTGPQPAPRCIRGRFRRSRSSRIRSFVTSDYTVSYSQTALSGVERDVDETTTKADLDTTIGLATPEARMFAVTASGIPQRVFDSESSLQAFLEQEMRRRLDLELDQHVIDTIDAASPATGTPTGTGLIAKARRAVAEHRALGSSPSVLAISPRILPITI